MYVPNAPPRAPARQNALTLPFVQKGTVARSVVFFKLALRVANLGTYPITVSRDHELMGEV